MNIVKIILGILTLCWFSDASADWFQGSERLASEVDQIYRLDVDRVCADLKCPDSISTELVLGIVAVESGTAKCAISTSKAYGPMQIKKIVQLDVKMQGDLCNKMHNLTVGIKYLKRLYTHHGITDQIDLLVAYKEGPTGYKRIKNRESFYYVERVQHAMIAIFIHSFKLNSHLR